MTGRVRTDQAMASNQGMVSNQHHARARSHDRAPISVLERVVLILSAFGPDDSSLRLRDLVDRSGLPKTTVHRLVGALLEVRLLERRASVYHLGGRLFELGMLAGEERRLMEVAMPFLQDLYARVHETVHLAVRNGTEVVYVAKVGGSRQAHSPSRIGGRMPLHCTAVGKVLLALADDESLLQVLDSPLRRLTPHTITAPGVLARQLERARKTAYATEYQESALGLVCVAAPVLDGTGRPRAALSIAGASGRFDPDRHVRTVTATAAVIGEMIVRREALFENT